MRLLDPYVIALLGTGLLSLLLAFATGRRRHSPGSTPLMFLSLAAAVWQVGYAFELGAVELGNKVIWAKFQYPGIAAAPIAWLALTIDYSGRGRWLTTRNLSLLAIFPAITVALTWTNEIHSLIWTDVAINNARSPSILVLGHGPWFWAFTAYGYLAMVAGIGFLVDTLLHFPRPYREQSLALLLSALVPWVANWAFLGPLMPGVHLDLTPFAFGVSCMLLAWAIAWAHFLDVSPVARDTLFERGENGVLVLDSLDRVVDCNPVARHIIGVAKQSPIGLPISNVWGHGSTLLGNSSNASARDEMVTLGYGPQRRHFNVSVSPLLGPGGRVDGKLILFNDATELVNAQRERLARATAVAKAEQLHDSRMRIMDVTESVRKSLAMHLHGVVQSKLIRVMHSIDKLVKLASQDELAAELTAIRDEIDQLIEDDIRKVSVQIHPDILRRGLIPALESLGDRYGTALSIKMELDQELRRMEKADSDQVHERVRLSAYRIVEEALTNVVKHAIATSVFVSLQLTPDGWLRLTVSDDGRGFELDDTARGLGIGIMEDYAQVVEGDCTIASRRGNGTTITANLPLSFSDHTRAEANPEL